VPRTHFQHAQTVFPYSAVQVLDYVTGILMGAKGFLPNLT
jgi:hypothetical protein